MNVKDSRIPPHHGSESKVNCKSPLLAAATTTTTTIIIAVVVIITITIIVIVINSSSYHQGQQECTPQVPKLLNMVFTIAMASKDDNALVNII
jgi:hypothetical protein